MVKLRFAPARGVCLVLALGGAACADGGDDGNALLGEPAPAAPSTAPFSCGVQYTYISTLQDDELASYGLSTVTDTAQVCETWTGSDYQVHHQQTGAGVDPETAPDATTATFNGGYLTAKRSDGTALTANEHVGADAFDFTQATAEEQQASYDEPYYGVYQPKDPNGGIELMTSRSPTGGPSFSTAAGAQANPRAAEVGKKVHGIRRPALRALLANKDEISRSPEGHRRFRSESGGEETIITVDPATELMTAQESRGPGGSTRARLHWALRGDRYVRERMEVESVVYTPEGRAYNSRATLVIQDLRVQGRP